MRRNTFSLSVMIKPLCHMQNTCVRLCYALSNSAHLNLYANSINNGPLTTSMSHQPAQPAHFGKMSVMREIANDSSDIYANALTHLPEISRLLIFQAAL